ncbi:hypothetical protein ABL78_4647 [Leptomonas seymouri]|uniref:CHASE domain-containing protein n=1 Tax=Leptomonas seymouri TaxID=5684 RepID=A0A0N1IKJ0_LEPSE|nr:hypothetical protein ABL78_4647 [Leptomonas seymouri]|eukprot:KPI86300.1 hypothetical protein ABL78_4647 [Leptomonas seymouri]
MKVFQTPTGNSAEDEQNNKRHARRYRVYLIILAVWIAFLVILATTLTPMLVLQYEDTAADKAYRAEENRLANDFTTEFRDAVLNAISAVYGFQGFIMGNMKTLPNMNGTKEKRVEGQYFPDFQSYAKLVNSSTVSIAVFLTAPGGVTYQFFPKEYGAALSNWDLLEGEQQHPHLNFQAMRQRSMWDAINSGKLSIAGPYRTKNLPFLEIVASKSSITLGSAMGGETWWIDLRQPVYKATADATISISTFWGFAMAALDVIDLLEDNQFEETMRENDMEYIVYTHNKQHDCIVVVSSWPQESDCTVPFMRDFIQTATVHDVLDDQLAWKVAVRSSKRGKQLTAHLRVIIVLASVLGTVGVFALVLYLIILCTRVYDGTVHAPKQAPFAMLTVGPCRGEELWDLASDQMVAVTDRLGKVLAHQMVRHRAYQIQQVHPLTTSYVTRTVSAAVQMAFDMIEELHRRPIDDALRHLLGDDGRLLLSYAVHWCNDAVVQLDTVEGGYRYEGPDVVYGGRMWVFAAPSVVTVSPTALSVSQDIPHLQYKLFDSVFLRGVTERQDLYVVFDPTNQKLCEAEALAAEQVRRARQSQRRAAESKSSDTNSNKGHNLYSFNHNGDDGSNLDIGSFGGYPHPHSGGSSGEGGGNRGSPDANGNAHSGSNSSTPLSGLRPRTAAAHITKKDGAVGITSAALTPVIVPSSVMSPPLPAQRIGPAVEAASNPLVLSATDIAALPERWMVPRLGEWSDTSSNYEDAKEGDDEGKSCSFPALSDEETLYAGNKTTEAFAESQADTGKSSNTEPQQQPTQNASLKAAQYNVCIPPPPALPPISSTARPTTSITANALADARAHGVVNHHPGSLADLSSRRVLDSLYGSAISSVGTSTSNTSSSLAASAIGASQRHNELSAAKSRVVVPPSAELTAAAAASGGHGVISKSPSCAPLPDGSITHARRITIGPTSSYDNPLAHNLATGSAAAAAIASAQDGAPLDVCAASASALRVAVVSFAGDGDPLVDSRVSLDSFNSDFLLRTAITAQVDSLLRTVFDRQAVALDVSYDSVRVLVYYFYSSYKILFRPLAAPERHNIYRRLVTAFGVPQQGILEHLAARCAIRFLQHHEETQTLLWDQQRRLQTHARSISGPSTASVSVSDDAESSSSS